MYRTFAVIGDPIDHSLSPHMHSAAFRDLGMADCSYIAYRIPRGELAQGLEALARIGVSGFNVTIPHKVDIIEHLDSMDESCSMVGAANTVERAADGALKGHNTDVDGFADPIRRRGIDLRGARVLLLGAGGAARAVVSALAMAGVGHITIANRTAESASGLAGAAKLAGIGGVDAMGLGPGVDAAARGCDMIVNATPIGLQGCETGSVPISAESINREAVVYDVVYRPINTDLIKKAKARGAVCILGYEMLLGQAARAFEIWHGGTKAPYGAMRRALLGGM